MAARRRQLLSEKQILNFIEELDSDDNEDTEDSSDDSEHCKLFMWYFFIVFQLLGSSGKMILAI